eukprot:4191296-Pyramimonas_sp.AAC.1
MAQPCPVVTTGTACATSWRLSRACATNLTFFERCCCTRRWTAIQCVSYQSAGWSVAETRQSLPVSLRTSMN